LAFGVLKYDLLDIGVLIRNESAYYPITKKNISYYMAIEA